MGKTRNPQPIKGYSENVYHVYLEYTTSDPRPDKALGKLASHVRLSIGRGAKLYLLKEAPEYTGKEIEPLDLKAGEIHAD